VLFGILLTGVLLGLLRMSGASRLYQRMTRWWLGKLARILAVQVTCTGTPAASATLWVANHISWLDIPVLGGVIAPCFLSKQEVRDWPVIGWLARQAGTLFITRGKAGAAAQASAAILATLQAGRSVLLFPEGTTTTGQDVGTFHARLFAAAQDAGVTVQPIAVRYVGRGGEPHPLVPFVGEQSLWENLQGILQEPVIAAQIHFLEPIDSTALSRKALAALCEQRIRQIVYVKPLAEI
jgi:1-acyl-sn-glycerol-3-phosphate acyltransferase